MLLHCHNINHLSPRMIFVYIFQGPRMEMRAHFQGLRADDKRNWTRNGQKLKNVMLSLEIMSGKLPILGNKFEKLTKENVSPL